MINLNAAGTDGDRTTINAGDSLVGGGGTDTLSIVASEINGAATYATGASTASIEVLKIQNVDANDALTLDVDLFAGLEKVVVTGGQSATTVTNSGIVNVEMNSTSRALTITADAESVQGTADSATVTLNNVAGTAATTLTYNGIESFNVKTANAASGTLSATVDRPVTITSADLESVTVSGDKSAYISATFSGVTAESQTAVFDASAATAGITADLTLGALAASRVKVTMSSKDDTVTYNSALTKYATVSGGDGTDTLRLGSSVAAPATSGDTTAVGVGVTGFEKLALEAGVTVDFKGLPNNTAVTEVTLLGTGSTTNAAATLTTVNQQASGTYTHTLATDATATLTANLTGAAGVASTLSINDIETLNLTSGGTSNDANSVTISNGTDLTAIKATGSKSLTITATAATNLLIANVDASGLSGVGNAFTLDASTSEADMTVKASSFVPTTEATLVNTITTGSGSDNVTGSAYRDTIIVNNGDNTVSGGAGNDSITSGKGADSIDGGAGVDTISTGLGNDYIDGGAGNDSIDAGAGDDTILGGDGNDSITLGTGDDSVDAGAGTDFIYMSDYDDDDVVVGGAGTDTLSASALTAAASTFIVQAASKFVDVTPGTSKTVTPQISGVETVYMQATLAAANTTATASTNESIDFSTSSGITNLYLEINDPDAANAAKLSLSEVDAAAIHLLDRETTDDLGELEVVGTGQASLTLKGYDFDGGTAVTISDVDAVTLTSYVSTSTVTVGHTVYGNVEADTAEAVTVKVDGVASSVTAPTLTVGTLSADGADSITLSAGSYATLAVGAVTSTSQQVSSVTITANNDSTVGITSITATGSDLDTLDIDVGVAGALSNGAGGNLALTFDSVDSATIDVASGGSAKLDLLYAGVTDIAIINGSTLTLGDIGVATEVSETTITGRGRLNGDLDLLGDATFDFSGFVSSGGSLTIDANDDDGDKVIYGNSTGNTFNTGGGDDYVVGGAGDDTVVAGAGDDTISGGAGVDSIDGGAGADYMTGGTGDDIFVIEAGDSVASTSNTLTAGGIAAGDTIVFANGVDYISDFAPDDVIDNGVTADVAPTSLIGVATTAVLTDDVAYVLYGTWTASTGTFTVAAAFNATSAKDALLVVDGAGQTAITMTGVVILDNLTEAIDTGGDTGLIGFGG